MIGDWMVKSIKESEDRIVDQSGVKYKSYFEIDNCVEKEMMNK